MGRFLDDRDFICEPGQLASVPESFRPTCGHLFGASCNLQVTFLGEACVKPFYSIPTWIWHSLTNVVQGWGKRGCRFLDTKTSDAFYSHTFIISRFCPTPMIFWVDLNWRQRHISWDIVIFCSGYLRRLTMQVSSITRNKTLSKI